MYACVIGALVAAACSGVGADKHGKPPTIELAAPTVDIGANDELMLPKAAMRLSSGDIIVADAHANSVIVFDANGRHRLTVGRQGSGPGEMQSPSWLGRCAGDSVFVLDPALSRVTVLDPAGRFARSFSWNERPTVLACSSHGTVAVASAAPLSESRPDPKRTPLEVVGNLSVVTWDGRILKSIGAVRVGEHGPLGRQSRLAAAGGRFVFGDGEREIRVFEHDGRRDRVLRIDMPERPATDAHRRASIDEQVAIFSEKATRERNRQFLSMFAMPKLLPLYSGLFLDEFHNLWLVASFPGDTTTLLRLLNESGTAVANVILPMPMTIYDIGRDYIIGSYLADDERMHVALFSFDPNALPETRR